MLSHLSKYHIILASASPRRRELLAGLGIDFEVRTLAGIDESYPDHLRGEAIAAYISKAKAEAYRATLAPNDLVITADTIVSATGLELQLFGGLQLVVDGRPFVAAESMGYRGLMLRDLPNAVMILGYTNASWTLKADLSSQYLCRLIRHMDAHGQRQVTPRQHGAVGKAPFLDLKSGYIERAAHLLPSQGDRMPWKVYQNFLLDLILLRHGRLEDGSLEFR